MHLKRCVFVFVSAGHNIVRPRAVDIVFRMGENNVPPRTQNEAALRANDVQLCRNDAAADAANDVRFAQRKTG